MNDNPSAIADPFAPIAPDEETELRALVRALKFAETFTLLFVRCNQPTQRQRLVSALRTELPQFTIQEIHFDAPITHLLDELRLHLTQPPPDAVFVSGLEYSLPTAAEAHATPFVANLNAARNSFSRVVPCPLVLWVPEYALTAIARGAPDFFSVRSGVYFFAPRPEEAAYLTESMTTGEVWTLANLSFAEKQERITAIETLIADYQALPLAQRDRYAEARLLARLGSLYLPLGQWAAAEAACQQSLVICREIGDRVSEGAVLNNLGNIYGQQGRWTEAEKCYQQSLVICREVGDRISERRTLGNLGNVYQLQGQWTKAKAAYQKLLAMWREMGDRAGEGQALNNLGNVYGMEGRWAEAEMVYQQSLAIAREVGDRVGEGRVLNNLGNVYGAQGRWAEAERCYRLDLAIARQVGDRVGEGQTLNNLGVVYMRQRRWAEAEMAYQQSLAIRWEVGDHIGAGKTLSNLALLQEAQGNIKKAIEYGRKALEVLATTEDEEMKAEVQKWVAEWEKQIEARSST